MSLGSQDLSSIQRLAKPFLAIPTTEGLFQLILAVYFLVCAHYTFPNFGGYGLTLPANYVAWMMMSILIGLGLWQWARARALMVTPQLILFWLGGLVLTLPLLAPGIEDLLLAGPRVAALIAGLLLYTAILQFRVTNAIWQQMLPLILAGAVLQSLIGLVQYCVLEPGNFMGYNTAENRPNGTFQQVNVMASFLATGFAISLFLALMPQEKPVSRLVQALRLVMAFSGPLLLVVIQSGTGQLAGLAVLLLSLPLILKTHALSKPFNKAWFGLATLGLITGLIALNSSVEGVKRGADIYQDPGARVEIYGQSLEVIRQNPVFGAGYGQFESAWRAQHAADASPPGNVIQGLHALSHPHNETLLWVVEGGLVAFIGLLLLAAGFLTTLFRLPWATGLVGLALTAPILIHTQTEYPLYHSGLHWITLILLLAFVDTHQSPPKAVAFPRIILPLSLAFLTPLLVIPFMVTGLQSLAVITQLEASKPRQYHRLLDVTNPAADMNRFQWHLWALRLNTALAEGNRQELTAYLAWSEKMSRGTPRSPLWVNQMIALRALGDFDAAEAKLAEARYLFGDKDDLRPFIGLDRSTRLQIQ